MSFLSRALRSSSSYILHESTKRRPRGKNFLAMSLDSKALGFPSYFLYISSHFLHISSYFLYISSHFLIFPTYSFIFLHVFFIFPSFSFIFPLIFRSYSFIIPSYFLLSLVSYLSSPTFIFLQISSYFRHIPS